MSRKTSIAISSRSAEDVNGSAIVSNLLQSANRQLAPSSQGTSTREDAHANANAQFKPAPNLSNKEERRVYYSTLVRKAEEQTHFFLLKQYNDIYAEFESCLKWFGFVPKEKWHSS
jgi:hypothetical protein